MLFGLLEFLFIIYLFFCMLFCGIAYSVEASGTSYLRIYCCNLSDQLVPSSTRDRNHPLLCSQGFVVRGLGTLFTAVPLSVCSFL